MRAQMNRFKNFKESSESYQISSKDQGNPRQEMIRFKKVWQHSIDRIKHSEKHNLRKT